MLGGGPLATKKGRRETIGKKEKKMIHPNRRKREKHHRAAANYGAGGKRKVAQIHPAMRRENTGERKGDSRKVGQLKEIKKPFDKKKKMNGKGSHMGSIGKRAKWGRGREKKKSQIEKTRKQQKAISCTKGGNAVRKKPIGQPETNTRMVNPALTSRWEEEGQGRGGGHLREAKRKSEGGGGTNIATAFV